MTLKGKGFYIWQVWRCDGGDPNAILAEAQMADLSHVLIKVADGEKTYNYDSQRRIDLAAPVVRLLKTQGIKVWGAVMAPKEIEKISGKKPSWWKDNESTPPGVLLPG